MLMLNCSQTTQLISKSLDRQLTKRERFAVRLHLFICKHCKRFSQQLLLMRDALTRLTKQIEQDESIQLPAETKIRIAHSIESAAD